ncbi:MAG TPA: catalase family peroxidase [Verrucomicrobiae bacterium]|nr:catalase family peroxidase [Verrucomicrobiae bacterium]
MNQSPDLTNPSSCEPPRKSLFFRKALIGAIIGSIALAFVYAGGWLTPRTLSSSRFTDGFEAANGPHPGFRRNHSKGVCVSGYFESDGKASALCKSSVFKPGRIPVLGRFSLGGGQPNMADAAHTPRGFALRFQLPNGEEWRTAMLNLPVFTVRTPQGFYDQLFAFAPDPATGKPDPAKLAAFLDKYPESAKARKLVMNQPVASRFGNSTYNSLNTFRFINEDGTVSFVRWSLAPLQPFKPIDSSNTSPADKNYLFDGLIEDIHQHPLQWRLIITVADAEDPTDDATLPWPPERRQIDAGVLTIEHIESDDVSPARDINFDPLILPNGMAASGDPLLSARSAVYSQSFTRRESEPKPSSAISEKETQR